VCSDNAVSALTFSVIEQLSAESVAVVRGEIGGDPDSWRLDEIGYGNVNLIFRLSGPKGRLLIKQAVFTDPYRETETNRWRA
jgi:5-methylthioribose kinase